MLKTVPRWPALLGYAGLIPFVVLAVAVWRAPVQHLELLHHALLTYAAVILGFMGAIHWGVAMQQSARIAQRSYLLSVVPPLLGWLAILIPVSWGYLVLVISFSLLCLYDILATKQQLTPSWYPVLRIPLTSVVVLALLAALFSL